VVGLAPGEPSLATVLQENGYATAAFLAGNPYLSPRFGYDQGFATFEDFLDGSVPPSEVPEKSPEEKSSALKSRANRALSAICHNLGPLGALYDEAYFQYGQRRAARTAGSLDDLRRFPSADVLVDQAGTWLNGIAGQPFFLWLHFMDPHSPYYPHVEALELMKEEGGSALRAHYLNAYWNRADIRPYRFAGHREEILTLYDAGIRWVDAQLARLVTELRRLGLWDDCTFALTADHGEEFLEHGGRYHSPSKVNEELVRVPLLLRAATVSRARQIAGPFSLLHLAPTLLESLGLSGPASFQGRSQWAALQLGASSEVPAITECVAECTNPWHSAGRFGARVLAVREGSAKLVVDFRSAQVHLFDLRTDPEERRPLTEQEHTPLRRRLLELAREHIASSWQERDASLRLRALLHDLQLS
jgi:arylsulfatase A-like enzyme